MVVADETRIVIDTNVLLRAIQLDNSLCEPSREAFKKLHRQNRQLCLTPQNVREFWNVCTRPADYNGLGMDLAIVERHARRLEKHFNILPDSAITYPIWRQLLVAHSVRGVQVHDAWLAAAVTAHGIRQILTYNVGDFARYRDIQPVDPRSL